MKRDEICPKGVYSLVSYRDSRQGWPVMILSQDSYQEHHRTRVVDYAARDRLVHGDYRRSAIGLLSVRLAFDMHSGRGDEGTEPPMSQEDFEAGVAELRELVSITDALTALNDSRDKAWDDRDHLKIVGRFGQVLGYYELLTGLQMVQGEYVALTLAEQERQRMVSAYAEEAEQRRVANVETFNALAARLDKLGVTGYHAANWESPTRFEKLSFEDMDTILALAETGHAIKRMRDTIKNSDINL